MYYTVIKHSGHWEHSRNEEYIRLQLVFSKFSSCSKMPVVFYHNVIHGLGLFISYIFCRSPVPKSYWIIFNFFKWTQWKPNVKFEKENKRSPDLVLWKT